MQYLKYPVKTMGISQNYNGKYSHYGESHGNPCAYPIDDACSDSGRDYFYAPCDLVVKRVYGVGNGGTNTIWMESKEKVKLANGKESYVTIMVIHPNDDTLKSFKAGQTYKQGAKMFLEGKDGNATGYHFHIEVATCKFSELKNNGWVKNNKGYWVISNKAIKPEDAFYVDKSFTKIKNSAGLKFKDLQKENANKKSQLYLPADATSWRVYKMGVQPVKGNECGFLRPSKFGGLTYDILGYTSDNVAIIQTRDYGKVQIYVAKSTGAIIKES